MRNGVPHFKLSKQHLMEAAVAQALCDMESSVSVRAADRAVSSSRSAGLAPQPGITSLLPQLWACLSEMDSLGGPTQGGWR